MYMRELIKKHKRFISVLSPIALGALFLVTCFQNCSDSVSFPEASLALKAKNEAFSATDGLYFNLLKFWGSWLGWSDFALRGLSILLGALAIMSIFLLVRYRQGKIAAGIAGLLCIVSPLFIYASRSVSAASLLTLLFFASIYCFAIFRNSKRMLFAIFGGIFCLVFLLDIQNIGDARLLSSFPILIANIYFAIWFCRVFRDKKISKNARQHHGLASFFITLIAAFLLCANFAAVNILNKDRAPYKDIYYQIEALDSKASIFVEDEKINAIFNFYGSSSLLSELGTKTLDEFYFIGETDEFEGFLKSQSFTTNSPRLKIEVKLFKRA